MKTNLNIITVNAELLAAHKAAWPCGKLEVGDTFEFNEAGELVLMTCSAEVQADELAAYCDRVKYTAAVVIITSTLGRTDKNGRRKVRYMAAVLMPGNETALWGNLGTAETGNWTGYTESARALLKSKAGDVMSGIGDDAGRAFLAGARLYFAPCGHYYA